MLKIQAEEQLNLKDKTIINAFKNCIELYSDQDLNEFYEDVKNAKFKNHNIGKGGSHVWINRKIDNQRIAIIIE